ncbi:MAG: hypothetical protein ACRENF_01570 [Thermodesulfobacteriota bacterium]
MEQRWVRTSILANDNLQKDTPILITRELMRGYSQVEFAEITGLCVRMLTELKRQGNPAFRAGKWWPYPWLLWTAGQLECKRRGRKRIIDNNSL